MSARAQRVARGEREGRPRAAHPPFSEITVSHRFAGVCTILSVAGIVLLAIRRWMLVGVFSPGLDGAQWLALGRGLDGNAIGRSTEGAYAPLVPVLAAIAESVAGPLLAVRLLAAASGLVASLAIWFVARSALGPVWGLAVTAIVIPASALAEPVLFGGYPQEFALAAGVIALWAVCRYLTRNPDHRWSLSLAGIAALVTAAAHHVYFPVAAVAILAAVGLWLSDRSRVNGSARKIGFLALALSPAFALFAAVAFAFMRAGYAAPLGASAQSLDDAWRYGTRESPELWLVILGAGAVGLAIQRRPRGDPAWLFAAGLLMPSGLVFLISGQPRLLPPILIGAGIAVGLCARWIASLGPKPHAAALLLAFAVAAMLAVPADRATSQFADFYRVVDDSLVRAAAAIKANGDSGAVAVREDRRGWPIGWWLEALLERPVIVGSDPRWLAFPAEREHARQAAALFDGGLDAETFRQRAMASGVRYLVVAKWDWIGWERWTTTPGFPVAELYDDDRYLVLRVT